MRLVFVGVCNLTDKKPGVILRPLMEDETLGQELIFNRKAMQHAVIGGVYEVEKETDTAWRLSEKKYVGMYGDAKAVTEWQLEERVHQVREDALKAERAATSKLPSAFAYMEPLRTIYRKQLPNGRRAIEVLLLEYLRRGN